MPHRITITAGPVRMEAELNDTETARAVTSSSVDNSRGEGEKDGNVRNTV